MSRPQRPPLARNGIRCGVCGHEEYADRIEETEAPMAQHMATRHPTEDWFDHNGRYHGKSAR